MNTLLYPSVHVDDILQCSVSRWPADPLRVSLRLLGCRGLWAEDVVLLVEPCIQVEGA